MSRWLNKWNGMVLGGLLALGAPAGWLFLATFFLPMPGGIYAELSHHALLYIYLLFSTEIVFCLLGYTIGSLIHKLESQVGEDFLTQIPNRRVFEPALKKIIAQGPTIMLMIDLDNFKLVNDELGHLTGDKALIEVGIIIQRNIRRGDVCARFGGDEFAVILPRAGLKDAYIVSNRILKELNAAVVAIHRSCGASIGIGAIHQGGDPTSLIELADNALYQAKQAGGKTIKHLVSVNFYTTEGEFDESQLENK